MCYLQHKLGQELHDRANDCAHLSAWQCFFLMHFLIHILILFFFLNLFYGNFFFQWILVSFYINKVHIIIPVLLLILSFAFSVLLEKWSQDSTAQWDNVGPGQAAGAAWAVGGPQWMASRMFWGSTNNGPELCVFARVSMRPCVYRRLRPAPPHLARIVSPAQTVPSSETPVIIEGSRHFCSCFCKELTRRQHAAAIRKSCQEPRYRG